MFIGKTLSYSFEKHVIFKTCKLQTLSYIFNSDFLNSNFNVD